MKSWILTGGISCGKSQVMSFLMQCLDQRVAIFSADQAAQAWLDSSVVLDEIASIWGADAISNEGSRKTANRNWLRGRVFSNLEDRRKLESILHPHVLRDLESRRTSAEKDGAELFLAEVPLHYEIGNTVTADLIIVVAASQTVQVRRLMERRGLEEPIIEQILRSQWPIEAKVERADVVIWNDGDAAALEAQVLTLARQHWHDESNRNP
jgi:dephospho-CoA kinase